LHTHRIEKKLVESGLLTSDQLDQAINEHKNTGNDLFRILVHSGLIKDKDLADLISKEMKITRFNADDYPLEVKLVDVVPLEMARRYQVAPLTRKNNLITLAMVNPINIDAFDAIEKHTNCEVEPVICSEQELMQIITSIYGMGSDFVVGFEGFGDMEVATGAETKSEPQGEDLQVSFLQGMAEEAPVVRIVNSMLAQAVRQGASDIHISPESSAAQIRFRIDGRLQEVPSPPKSMLLPIISRVKILANMDIAIAMVPQDGRFSVKTENKEINVRVSSLPTIYGENIVMRLLDMGATLHLALERLGMTQDDINKISEVIEKPYGMILSTGPTGSGKTTSLYSIIKKINKPDINIITLEDPVEYRVDKIRQVQLNVKAGMTFASGLRAILRQDPDVIMVGEIRDKETAEIAVRAALTGHRVLSTVHTNDSAGAITRLIEMGIEPFLVSSVLLVSFAQRLIRTICPYCKERYQPSEKLLNFFNFNYSDNLEFYKGKGCINCFGSGFRGRTGIFEILVIDEEIQEMIYYKRSALEIISKATKNGKLKTLKEEAKSKILNGITTLEEAASTVMI